MMSVSDLIRDCGNPSLVDLSLRMSREMKLSKEASEAIGPSAFRLPELPKVYPYFSIQTIKVKGKEKLVPTIGVKGTF